MFGSVGSAKEFGAIPCAISWLYDGINQRRQKTGARFSVRVSALGVSASKPGSSSKDLLKAHATGMPNQTCIESHALLFVMTMCIVYA